MIQRSLDIVATTDHEGTRTVTIGGNPLPPRFDLRNHSPDGFSWGYGGSGPAQLALAILAAVLGDDDAAQALYQDYKWEFISKIKAENWTLPSLEVMAWVRGDCERAKWLTRN